jgi:Leucine-rich repeat (LRR) protein
LSSNSISEVQPELFADLENLEHLDISKCKLTYLPPSTFSSNSKLEELNLAGNNLRLLDLDVVQPLHKLSRLILHNNPLECNCRLQPLWYWSREKNVTTALESEGEPKCKGPEESEWAVLEGISCSKEWDPSTRERAVVFVGSVLNVIEAFILLSIFLLIP